jgi:hypothetical protein
MTEGVRVASKRGKEIMRKVKADRRVDEEE